jgi:hypothetical protein
LLKRKLESGTNFCKENRKKRGPFSLPPVFRTSSGRQLIKGTCHLRIHLLASPSRMYLKLRQ